MSIGPTIIELTPALRELACLPTTSAGADSGMEPRATSRPAEDPSPAPDILLIVHGTPGPQGSKSFKGMRASKTTGKSTPVLVESSKKVAPWRADVEHAAVVAGISSLTGPLAVSMAFTLAPPKRLPKGRTRPTCYPDLSKLIRATEDALTGQAWIDDAQVVEYRSTAKYYPGQHPDALDEPGAVIRVWTIGGAA